MRKDMSKVVIERPRHGHADRSEKTRLRLRHFDADREYDEYPGHLPASMMRGTKSFSDFLNPLTRFLRSNVGRPWDQVYSELCAHLDRRKTTGRHVFEHLEDFIETNCFTGDDGEIYAITPYRGIRAIGDLKWRRDAFYVHPRTGLLLREQQRTPQHEREARRRKVRKTIERRPLSINQSYVRFNGTWYIGDYVETEGKAPSLENLKQGEPFRYWDGKRWMQLVSKRKCTQKELNEAGLKNLSPKK